MATPRDLPSGPLRTFFMAAATLEARVANGEEFESRLSPSTRRWLAHQLDRVRDETIPRVRSALDLGGA
jgi:hypothetical protein